VLEAPELEEPIRKEPKKEEPKLQEKEEAPTVEVIPEIKITSQQGKKDASVEEEETDEVILVQEEEAPDSSSKKKSGKGKKLKNKQSITLSEFFARKDEEAHTKLRMCIVQNGDTLDTLSERYKVPVTQIQRVNQLELNQDIYEGQVVYIPQAQTQR
jgi:stage VI sporulation protein D